MSYEVLVQPPAAEDLDSASRWIAQSSAERAGAWLNGAFEAIRTLSDFPRRCPLAPESDAFEAEIRQLLYGEFRILFSIEGSSLVRILHVRHGGAAPSLARRAGVARPTAHAKVLRTIKPVFRPGFRLPGEWSGRR